MFWIILLVIVLVLVLISAGAQGKGMPATSQEQENINVPNPESANPKDVIWFIYNNDRDVVKQVYHQLLGLKVSIPPNLDAVFREKINKGFFFLEDVYWRTSIEEYQSEKERLSEFANTYCFELKGVHVKAYKEQLKRCIVYDSVTLKAEPHNKYDANAIKIVFGAKMIGRVPIEETVVVHEIIKSEHKAFIESITNFDDYLDVTIIVYHNLGDSFQ